MDRCDECLGHFCAECFVRDGEWLRCQACHAAAPLRAAEAVRRGRGRYRLAGALRERRASLVASAVILGMLGGGAATVVWGARTGTTGNGAIEQALGAATADLQTGSAPLLPATR